jgi:hypothetical protein
MKKKFGQFNLQRIIELSTQNIVIKLSKIWVCDPGSGAAIADLLAVQDMDAYKSVSGVYIVRIHFVKPLFRIRNVLLRTQISGSVPLNYLLRTVLLTAGLSKYKSVKNKD